MNTLSRAALPPLVFALAAVAPVPAAPVPAPVRAEAGERERLRGEWTLVRHAAPDGSVRGHRGNSLPDHFLLRFEGAKVVTEYDHGDPSLEVESALALDPSSRPRRVDLTVTGGSSSAALDWKGQVRRGVYEIDGDRLLLCLSDDGARPSGFGPGAGRDVYELRRVRR